MINNDDSANKDFPQLKHTQKQAEYVSVGVFLLKLAEAAEATHREIAVEIAEIRKYRGEGEERTCTIKDCFIIRNMPKDAEEMIKCGHSEDPHDREGCLRFCHKDGDPFYIADFRIGKDGKKIWVRGSHT